MDTEFLASRLQKDFQEFCRTIHVRVHRSNQTPDHPAEYFFRAVADRHRAYFFIPVLLPALFPIFSDDLLRSVAAILAFFITLTPVLAVSP